jgi:hypothetical protein
LSVWNSFPQLPLKKKKEISVAQWAWILIKFVLLGWTGIVRSITIRSLFDMGLTHSKSVSLITVIYSPRASAAVIRFLGSIINILLMRSFAPVDIDGHGELFKSSLPAKIASNMPFSVSKNKTYWFHHQLSKENSNKICSDSKKLVSWGLVTLRCISL